MVVVRGEEEEVRRRGVEGTKAEMCILVNVETGGGGKGFAYGCEDGGSKRN